MVPFVILFPSLLSWLSTSKLYHIDVDTNIQYLSLSLFYCNISPSVHTLFLSSKRSLGLNLGLSLWIIYIENIRHIEESQTKENTFHPYSSREKTRQGS